MNQSSRVKTQSSSSGYSSLKELDIIEPRWCSLSFLSSSRSSAAFVLSISCRLCSMRGWTYPDLMHWDSIPTMSHTHMRTSSYLANWTSSASCSSDRVLWMWYLGSGIEALRGCCRSSRLRRRRCTKGWCCRWRSGWEGRLDEKSEIFRFPQCAFCLVWTHLNLEVELQAKQASTT